MMRLPRQRIVVAALLLVLSLGVPLQLVATDGGCLLRCMIGVSDCSTAMAGSMTSSDEGAAASMDGAKSGCGPHCAMSTVLVLPLSGEKPAATPLVPAAAVVASGYVAALDPAPPRPHAMA